MSKLGRTVKSFLGFTPEEEYFYEEEEMDSLEDSFQTTREDDLKMAVGDESPSSRITKTTIPNPSRTSTSSARSYSEFSSRTSQNTETNRVREINQSRNTLSVVLSRPLEYKDCTDICMKLRERTTVVVNFEHLKNREDKMRILDFIYGCCFAIDGNAQRISEHVYIIAPKNVDIYDSFDQEEEEEEYHLDALISF